MSGHSKWSTIKHKKAITDKKKSDVFSKLAKAITVASRNGGDDIETNYTLRNEVQKAKSMNMPKDKIEKAIQRGTGKLKEGEMLQELILEAFGPEGVGLLIRVTTNNRNRTTAEIKHIILKYGGKFAGEGSVRWLFREYGYLQMPNSLVRNRESFELLSIDAGAQDIMSNGENITVYTKINDIQKILKVLKKEGYNDIKIGLEWVPKNIIKISKKGTEKLNKLYIALSEQNDIQEIFSNVN